MEANAGDDEARFKAETRRLAELLRHPLRYQQRRREDLTIEKQTHCSWTVTQQILIPKLAEERAGQMSGSNEFRIISLGLFSKRRLPDITIYDGAGHRLPLLGRQQHGQVLASILLPKFKRKHLPNHRQEDAESDALSDFDLARLLDDHVPRIVFLNEEAAVVQRNRLLSFLRSSQHPGALKLASDSDFVQALESLCGTTNLLALVRAEPGEVILVSHTYSDGMDYRGRDYRSTDIQALHGSNRRMPRIRQTIDLLLTIYYRLLVWLCMSGRMLIRQSPSANHTQSEHVMAEAPAGTSVTRIYWSRLGETSPVPDDQPREHDEDYECQKSVLSAHSLMQTVEDNGRWFMEIQMERGGNTRSALLLSLFVALLASYTYRHPLGVHSSFQAIDLIVAAPGTLAGVLVQSRPEFSIRLGRAPRSLVLLMAFVSGLLSISFALGWREYRIEDLSVVLAAIACASTLLLAFIVFGPRFQGRKMYMAQRSDIRRGQFWSHAIAGLALPVLILVTVWFVEALIATHYLALGHSTFWEDVLQRFPLK